MKNTLVYSIIFLFAFGLVTGALFYFNGQFNSMFEFDFSPPKPAQIKEKPVVAAADSLKSDSTMVVSDSSAVSSDSTTNHSQPTDNTLVDAKHSTEKQASKPKVETLPVTENPMVPKTNMKSVVNRDSIYKSWVTETVKLYEIMDSKKAAKVILGYSDNIARDIILKMKKKKAAEILAELKPEVVTRIISVN